MSRRVKKYDAYDHASSARRTQGAMDFSFTPSVQLNAKTENKKNRLEFTSAKKLETPRKIATKNYSVKKHDQTSKLALGAVREASVETSRPQSSFIAVTTTQTMSAVKKMFFGLGFAVFMVAGLIVVQVFLAQLEASKQANVLGEQTEKVDAQGVGEGTGTEPSEDKPSDEALFSYFVAPEKPRFIRIPEIATYARVKEVGLTNAGAVDAPWNIHDASWYDGSVLPGSKKGVSMLVGHVSGRSTPGVFKDIASLSEGSIIEVERGDGVVLKYKVDTIEEYSVKKIDMAKILYEVPKDTHSLRLMTCSGEYNRESDSYNSRTVVYASPTS